LTRVDEEATLLPDFDEEKSSARSRFPPLWLTPNGKAKINILDTPGYNIFINDTRAALAAAEASLVVVDAVAGVEVQTEKVWAFSDEFKLPRALVINKLDRERSSFERTLESIRSIFGRTAVPIQLPWGAEREFKGVIDLVRMKAYSYTPAGDGKGKESDIPADMADEAQVAHEVLVEMVAEGNDALLEEFFEKGTLPVEHILDGLKSTLRDMRIFPVLCASAQHNIGSDQILNFIAENLPSPTDRGTVTGTQNGKEVARKIADTEPVSAFVFKTTADPFAGRITFFKVYSGILKNDANLQNVQRGTAERLAHIARPWARRRHPWRNCTGDIGAVS
jgi:elongation factor G